MSCEWRRSIPVRPVPARPVSAPLGAAGGSLEPVAVPQAWPLAPAWTIDYPRRMIPRLLPDQQLAATYRDFLSQLRASSFSGDIHTDFATRLVSATDNSVYQIVPSAVVFPRDEADIARLLEVLGRPEHRAVKLSPRGGGTGTNGQALCDGVIVDVSRYMREILELDLDGGWVRVQPGVVLDQLNAFLRPHGVFFAPNLSPSSRATLGGMISTDASGKGSRVYGKTSEHVLGLRSVLIGGHCLETRRLDPDELQAKQRLSGPEGDLYRSVAEIVLRSQERISTDIPRLKRFLTGYDLAHVLGEDGSFDLGRVLSGSEGTLAVLSEARLRLTPIARHRALVAIRYTDFDAALRAAQTLVKAEPGAIETIDDTIVSLAQGDVIWHSVRHLIDAAGEPPLRAVNLVEFESSDPDVVSEKTRTLCASLDRQRGQPGMASGYTVATAPEDISALWTLRKKGVGLLGNARGQRRPVPFVEDTAVPPERLADYIAEFRALLDRHGLRYGMFGHVDVGCLHVRPALNLQDPADEELLVTLTDEVAHLVKKYGGVLWGEHGRGYRSEYTPTFFGPELYAELRAVKAAFDPENQLNPGKLVTPSRSQDKLVAVASVTRGSFDRQISEPTRRKYETSINCNGNGACFDWNPDSVMCPSSKVTRDRIHSPKGRAGILREWLRLTARRGHDAGASGQPPGVELFRAREEEADDFSHEVYDAMAGCLACKACATQCPIHVDIPALRADFLHQYHSRYRRPLKDYFVAGLELLLSVLVWFPRLANAAMSWGWVQRVLSWVGIVDTPMLAERTLRQGLRERAAPPFDLRDWERRPAAERQRCVLLAQDAFTSFYEPNVALSTYDLLTRLGREVYVLPFRQNGKGLHVKGFLGWFRRVAQRNRDYYRSVAALGVPIVGVEPAVTLTYRDEYKHELGQELGFEIELLQEYLARELPGIQRELGDAFPRVSVAKLRLFGHCTEKTAQPRSQVLWQEVMAAFGAEAELMATGCCGMCGVFGHERAHLDESRGIFELSWNHQLPEDRSTMLATGHSCRSQVKRFAGFVPRHPAEVLAAALTESPGV